MSALDDDLLQLPAGSLVLDLGAAGGVVANHLGRLRYHVVAVEPERDLVLRLRGAAAGQVATCQGDGTALPFRSGGFDGAVLIEVLEHVPDPDLVLRELRRVLVEGGRLTVAVPTGYTEALYSRLHPRYAANAHHLHRFTLAGLEDRLGRAGLRVDGVETDNLAPALAWCVHALLRTPADHTGAVLRRRWVDYGAAGLVRAWRRTPGLSALHRVVARRFGKSWYVRCVAT